ncbi:hypothetical protein BDZ94DRAFT_345426 [Collybia nuda]|uniref:Uncharacterized protein n=1 Tax=Collybia nuda TaxID=64659 RepID=A0A9P5YB48_9AGAR|nr:hypothetical protein BDZ94DRAFT_345426 [Collybia nuda]
MCTVVRHSVPPFPQAGENSRTKFISITIIKSQTSEPLASCCGDNLMVILLSTPPNRLCNVDRTRDHIIKPPTFPISMPVFTCLGAT